MSIIPSKILKKFPNFTSYKENVNIFEIQKSYVLKQIREHEITLDKEHLRDYIDVYLSEMNEHEVDNSFTKNDLATSMLDFLHAGTETSSTTLKWIVLYLTLYQEVQEK